MFCSNNQIITFSVEVIVAIRAIQQTRKTHSYLIVVGMTNAMCTWWTIARRCPGGIHVGRWICIDDLDEQRIVYSWFVTILVANEHVFFAAFNRFWTTTTCKKWLKLNVKGVLAAGVSSLLSLNALHTSSCAIKFEELQWPAETD